MGDNSIPRGFTPWHLAYLSNNGLLDGEIMELGPMVEMPEAEDAIRQHLIDVEGVLTDEGDLTEGGKNLLLPLTHYAKAWWGVVTLHAFKREMTLEMDEALVQMGLNYSIPDVPKVFFLITFDGRSTLTCAVRAGDELSVTQQPVVDVERSVGEFLYSMCDPEGQWRPASFRGFRLPHTVTTSVGFSGLDREHPAADISRIRKVFEEYDAPTSSADSYISILKAKPAATMEVLMSTSVSNVTHNAASLGFYCDLGAVVMFPEETKRVLWTHVEPGDASSTTSAVEALNSVPTKQRLKTVMQ